MIICQCHKHHWSDFNLRDRNATVKMNIFFYSHLFSIARLGKVYIIERTGIQLAGWIWSHLCWLETLYISVSNLQLGNHWIVAGTKMDGDSVVMVTHFCFLLQNQKWVMIALGSCLEVQGDPHTLAQSRGPLWPLDKWETLFFLSVAQYWSAITAELLS